MVKVGSSLLIRRRGFVCVSAQRSSSSFLYVPSKYALLTMSPPFAPDSCSSMADIKRLKNLCGPLPCSKYEVQSPCHHSGMKGTWGRRLVSERCLETRETPAKIY